MATYFSDHFSGVNPDTGVLDNAYLDKTKLPPAGIGHGRIRYARAEITLNAASTDEIRMMQLRSSDRIFQVYLTCTDSGSAGLVQTGLYKSGVSHDGPALDANIIGTFDPTTARSHLDIWGTGSAPDSSYMRGRTLWELVTLPGSGVAGEYTTNPAEDWDLILRFHAGTDVSTQIILEVLYTTGD